MVIGISNKISQKDLMFDYVMIFLVISKSDVDCIGVYMWFEFWPNKKLYKTDMNHIWTFFFIEKLKLNKNILLCNLKLSYFRAEDLKNKFYLKKIRQNIDIKKN